MDKLEDRFWSHYYKKYSYQLNHYIRYSYRYMGNIHQDHQRNKFQMDMDRLVGFILCEIYIRNIPYHQYKLNSMVYMVNILGDNRYHSIHQNSDIQRC
jgi:hypothetical protein